MAASRRYVSTTLWVIAGGILTVTLFLVLTRGSAVLVGTLLLLAAAFGTGVLLDKLDSSRRPPEKRPPNWEGHPEDFWGFRGRPGA